MSELIPVDKPNLLDEADLLVLLLFDLVGGRGSGDE